MKTLFDLRENPSPEIVAELNALYGDNINVIHLDDKAIHKCIGCWDCWLKTPGKCVMKDDLEKAYKAYVNSDLVILLMDTAQGFINHRAKAFIDRSIPHYLPYIIMRDKECQHAKRYEKYAKLVFHFNTEGLTETEENIIEDYLYRTAYHHKTPGYRLIKNEQLEIKELHFRKPNNKQLPMTSFPTNDKLIIYNGSPRKVNSNSGIILNQVSAHLKDRVEIRDLKDKEKWNHWASSFSQEEHVLFFMPLYVHAMPSHVMAFIEMLTPSQGNLSFFIQSGFPESSQSFYLEAYLEQLTLRLQRSYGGTAIKGGMEGLQMRPGVAQIKMIIPLVNAIDYLETHNTFDPSALKKLARPVRYNIIMRFLYRVLARKIIDFFWNSKLKANNAYEHALARPYVDKSSAES